MFFPFHGDFSASPHPHAVDFEVALNSVNAVSCETVLAEVVDVSDVTVFQVVCQVADKSLA
jgi:hypothetical protein